MEHEVEPLIERAAGDVEMGIEMAGEAIGVEGAGAAAEGVTFDAMTVAEGMAGIAEFAEVLAVPEIGLPLAMVSGVTYLAHKLSGKKRKRKPDGVISRRAPTRPPGTERPGKMAKKVKTGKSKRSSRVKTAKRTAKPLKRPKSAKKMKSKKKKSSSYAVTIKQEVHGKFRRKNVSYFGFQATAGLNELFKIAADAIIRAHLRIFHVTVRRTDEVVPVVSAVPAIQTLRLDYRRTKYDDGTDGGYSSGSGMNFSSGTYESHVQAFADELEAKVRGGYYPYALVAFNSSGAEVYKKRQVGDAKLMLSVKRTIKLRNVTKNDDNGDTMTSLDTNPIQGRLYKFRHDTPRVNPVIYESDQANFAKFHDRYCTAGVIFGPQRAAADDHDGVPVTPSFCLEDRVLSSPPPGGRVWDNMSSSKKVGLAPGQAAAHKMQFKYSGTVRQFLDKFAASAYQPPSIGYCHMFGFEQKFKTDANDEINVEYDCDDVLKGGVQLKREDLTPPTVISHHAHNSAYV